MAPKSKAKKGKVPPKADEEEVGPEDQGIAWPALIPLAPQDSLSLVTVVPNQIIVIPRFWTSKLCKNFITFLSMLPLQTTPGKPRKGEAVRVNDRFQVDDAVFAKRLWEETALQSLVQESDGDVESSDMISTLRESLWGGHVLGLNPNIRVYRYREGQFFAPHYDESNAVSLPGSPNTPGSPDTPAKTTWTLLIYLSSPQTGCIGGETVFYPEENAMTTSKKSPSSKRTEPVVVKLETGMALLHKHGPDCMLHEGREVSAGEKWVLRSDLCVKR